MLQIEELFHENATVNATVIHTTKTVLNFWQWWYPAQTA